MKRFILLLTVSVITSTALKADDDITDKLVPKINSIANNTNKTYKLVIYSPDTIKETRFTGGGLFQNIIPGKSIEQTYVLPVNIATIIDQEIPLHRLGTSIIPQQKIAILDTNNKEVALLKFHYLVGLPKNYESRTLINLETPTGEHFGHIYSKSTYTADYPNRRKIEEPLEPADELEKYDIDIVLNSPLEQSRVDVRTERVPRKND